MIGRPTSPWSPHPILIIVSTPISGPTLFRSLSPSRLRSPHRVYSRLPFMQLPSIKAVPPSTHGSQIYAIVSSLQAVHEHGGMFGSVPSKAPSRNTSYRENTSTRNRTYRLRRRAPRLGRGTLQHYMSTCEQKFDLFDLSIELERYVDFGGRGQ
ncbi:hypothetical protein BDQ12DRAFT_677927 [Crucibulum laeve]|uniref:Uncharacterized protein n=1 Tax=Crucibulum laeve TaxID=68775 RepID=A0A5C3MAL5_9AGAR|nr:hypothetical protein BDQ12DRAFT_677927 [Crucibulum laeve]